MNIAATVLCISGALFFIAGAVGLIRLPDTLSRLHALTKADNVGLGLLALGVGLGSGDPWFTAKCLLVWLLMLVVSSVTSVLVASHLTGAGEPGDRLPGAAQAPTAEENGYGA